MNNLRDFSYRRIFVCSKLVNLLADIPENYKYLTDIFKQALSLYQSGSVSHDDLIIIRSRIAVEHAIDAYNCNHAAWGTKTSFISYALYISTWLIPEESDDVNLSICLNYFLDACKKAKEMK